MAQNYDLTQTGPELQERVDQVFPNRDAIDLETEQRQINDRRWLDESKLYTDAETTRAEGVEADLQTQIDEIVGGGATVSLTANKSAVFVGEESSITLTASCNKPATSITISREGMESVTGSGTSLQHTDTVTPEAPGTLAYSAAFVIFNQQRTATCNVSAVYPIYFGAGMEQSDVLDVAACRASARTSPNGTYNVTIAESAKYIWFFVPSNMPQITSAKMNGFDFPLQTLADVTDESNVTYKVYRTPNTNEVGTYSIVINP